MDLVHIPHYLLQIRESEKTWWNEEEAETDHEEIARQRVEWTNLDLTRLNAAEKKIANSGSASRKFKANFCSLYTFSNATCGDIFCLD